MLPNTEYKCSSYVEKIMPIKGMGIIKDPQSIFAVSWVAYVQLINNILEDLLNNTKFYSI